VLTYRRSPIPEANHVTHNRQSLAQRRDGLRGAVMKRDDQHISRRRAVAGTVLALGAVAAAMATLDAEAQQTISQADAKYQVMPNGAQRCSLCVNFQPPKACKFVQGDISPGGWCQLYSARS
jgi:hypothetical protein